MISASSPDQRFKSDSMIKSSIDNYCLSPQDEDTHYPTESVSQVFYWLYPGLGDWDWRHRRQTPVILNTGAGDGKVGRKAKDTRKLYI